LGRLSGHISKNPEVSVITHGAGGARIALVVYCTFFFFLMTDFAFFFLPTPTVEFFDNKMVDAIDLP